MNIEIYKYIAAELCIAIDKSYKKGIKSIAGKTKETLQFSMKYATNPLIDISYTDVDLAMISNFKVEAFTVAGVMSYELEEKLKKLAVEIQSGKHPLAEGETDIKKVWKDEAMNILADYIPVADMPPPSYLQTNLQTAINSSYHGSRWQRLQDPNIKNLYPAYQYKTRKDGRVRPEHVTLDDKIFQNEDPIWSRIIPPNGWNCRCYFTPLTSEEIQSSNSPLEPITDDEARKRIIKQAGISKDFDRNPGEVRSIWGKWLDIGLKGKSWSEIFNSSFKYDRSVSKLLKEEQLSKILEENTSEFREVEYNKKNWDEEFPNNMADTIFNEPAKFKDVKVNGKKVTQFEKLDLMDRKIYMGLIKPTLKDPIFILKDKHDGLIFLKSFKNATGRIDFASIGYKEGDLIEIISNHEKNKFQELLDKFKYGEVLHFKTLSTTSKTGFSLWNTTPTQPEIFELDTKLKFPIDIKNIKIITENKKYIQVKIILSKANEIWGKTYLHYGLQNSEVNYIKYSIDGFYLVKVKNNEAYEFKSYNYSDIDKYREGVLLI